jgi:cytochrome b
MEARDMRQVKVWDLFVRLFHWGLALAVLGSFLTSERDALVHAHAAIGLAVLALVATRVAWGFLGTPPARFAAFVRGPRQVLAYARQMVKGRPPAHLSHNPLGGAMIVALGSVLLGLVATGALVYAGPGFGGALAGHLGKRTAHGIGEVHEALSGALLALIGAHVAGVLLSSLLERQNLPMGMITGWKRDPAGGEAPAPRPGALVARLGAALLVGVAATVGLGLLLGLPARARAASPVAQELLRGYEAAARLDDPGFRAFQPAEGGRIYATTHLRDGAPIACATCHTSDPRRAGVTPAGKRVEPLAPSANPERLTDGREVEKWFRRNCTQVLGRECTAAEKGHFLAFLLSL